MALVFFLCLCLLCEILFQSGEIAAITSAFESSTLTENFSFTTRETDTRETGTIINSIGSSTLSENFSFTITGIDSRQTDTLINDIGYSTITENFSFITTETDSGEIATEINTIDSDRSSNSTELINNLKYTVKNTTSTETGILLNDIETTTDNPTYTTTETEASECNATKRVNISQNYQKLIGLRNQLDELFKQIQKATHSFVKTKNLTTDEFTTNLTKNYMQLSRKFVECVRLQNTTIRRENNTKYEKYEIRNIDEYEEKLEIVEIISKKLGETAVDETLNDAEFYNNNISEQSAVRKELALFDELYRIITLNKKIRELEDLVQEQNETYETSLKIEDLDDVIATLKDIIKLHNEMLHGIRNSETLKYLYDDEYMPKSNMIRELVNTSNLEGKISRYEQYLIEEYEEHELDEALLQLDEIIRPIILGTIFVVGITGNVVLLLVFIRHADMRTAPNVMIINLNVSDILGLIFNIFLYIIETLTEWTFGNALCKLYRACRYLALGLSVYSIVVISVQRYIALTDYFSFGFRCRFFGKFQPILNVLFVWVLASAFAIPRAITAQVQNLVCWSGTLKDLEFLKKFEYVDFAVYCALPFIIITVTSGVSSLRLKRSIKQMPGEAVGQEKAIKARVVSSNIFLALTIVFAICYIPYFLFMAFTRNVDYIAPFMTKKYVSFGFYCLVHSNASFNPIALYIVSAKYRKYMRIYLCYGKFYGKRKISGELSGSSNATIETRM